MDYLQQIMSSGRVLLSDTKVPKQVKPPTTKSKGVKNPAEGSGVETDPHKNFVKRAIQEKLKKQEVTEIIQKFCDAEDAKL